MVCERCHKNKKNVRVVIDPYNQDVNNEEIEMALCPECEQERRDDI
jgi:protein-arginine kinase activator protein McsA